jgi:hypothetical protein
MAGEPVLVSENAKSFRVYTNPSLPELSEIGSLVRFTANTKDKNIYVWEFNSGHHGDVSIALKLDDSFNSLDFLKGHAERNDGGNYEMVGSDFLNSFVGKMTGKEKVFLRNLINQDWDWVDDYIKVTGWIGSFRGLSKL